MRLPDLSSAYSAANRNKFLAAGAVLVGTIAALDWIIHANVSHGVLYLFPIMLVAPVLKRVEVAALSALCAYLREIFSPSPWAAEVAPGVAVSPLLSVCLELAEMALVLTSFLGVGLFVGEVTRKRQFLIEHVRRIEKEAKLRKEAEEQLRVLVESSPAAILTADAQGKIL